MAKDNQWLWIIGGIVLVMGALYYGTDLFNYSVLSASYFDTESHCNLDKQEYISSGEKPCVTDCFEMTSELEQCISMDGYTGFEDNIGQWSLVWSSQYSCDTYFNDRYQAGDLKTIGLANCVETIGQYVDREGCSVPSDCDNQLGYSVDCVSNKCVYDCTESWTCTDWDICSGGYHQRVCTDSKGCYPQHNKPSETQPCSCTMEDWRCGNWTACVGGQQSRVCTDYNFCGTTNDKPAIVQTCGGTCTEDWTCGSWESCANNQQARICTDSNKCGTTIYRPSLTKSCNAACSEYWVCSSWGMCSDGQQTRGCTDNNQCGTTLNKPATTKSCSDDDPEDCITTIGGTCITSTYLFIGIGLIVLLALASKGGRRR